MDPAVMLGHVATAVSVSGRPWRLPGPAAGLVGLDDRLRIDAVDDGADVQRAVPLAVLLVVGAEEVVSSPVYQACPSAAGQQAWRAEVIDEGLGVGQLMVMTAPGTAERTGR